MLPERSTWYQGVGNLLWMVERKRAIFPTASRPSALPPPAQGWLCPSILWCVGVQGTLLSTPGGGRFIMLLISQQECRHTERLGISPKVTYQVEETWIQLVWFQNALYKSLVSISCWLDLFLFQFSHLSWTLTLPGPPVFCNCPLSHSNTNSPNWFPLRGLHRNSNERTLWGKLNWAREAAAPVQSVVLPKT